MLNNAEWHNLKVSYYLTHTERVEIRQVNGINPTDLTGVNDRH